MREKKWRSVNVFGGRWPPFLTRSMRPFRATFVRVSRKPFGWDRLAGIVSDVILYAFVVHGSGLPILIASVLCPGGGPLASTPRFFFVCRRFVPLPTFHASRFLLPYVVPLRRTLPKSKLCSHIGLLHLSSGSYRLPSFIYLAFFGVSSLLVKGTWPRNRDFDLFRKFAE